jgi:hypothetical protein
LPTIPQLRFFRTCWLGLWLLQSRLTAANAPRFSAGLNNEGSVVTNFVRGARRPPRDKSQSYKTTPAEAGFTPKKPTRSDGLYRTLLRSPQIYLRALSAERCDVCNY